MEVEVVLSFELRGGTFVVVVEGEGWAIDVLAAEGSVDALFVGQFAGEGFSEDGFGEGEACGCGGKTEKIAAIDYWGPLGILWLSSMVTADWSERQPVLVMAVTDLC